MKSMQKPKIGISLRVVEAPSYDEKRDALSHDWPKLLEKLGFNPIYIPNTLSHVDEFFSDMSLDGLILSGGDNIGENKNRDETENLLLKLAIEKIVTALGDVSKYVSLYLVSCLVNSGRYGKGVQLALNAGAVEKVINLLQTCLVTTDPKSIPGLLVQTLNANFKLLSSLC